MRIYCPLCKSFRQIRQRQLFYLNKCPKCRYRLVPKVDMLWKTAMAGSFLVIWIFAYRYNLELTLRIIVLIMGALFWGIMEAGRRGYYLLLKNNGAERR